MKFFDRTARSIRHLATYGNIRHYRGHGIHSPFVYNLVRNVITCTRTNGNGDVFYAMQALGLPRKASVQLQNLYRYLDFEHFTTVGHDGMSAAFARDTLYFTCADLSEEKLENTINDIRAVKGTVVVLFPRHSRVRVRLLRAIRSRRSFLSIDNRRFIILFFSGKVPGQHYKL